MTTIIVARYDEDISWLKKYANFNIIIYNKGKAIQKEKSFRVENLDNIGRESHTWLFHIIKNYYNLDKFNIFIQGRIDDLECMAYKDLNSYYKDLLKNKFSVSRFGLLGPSHWGHNVGIEKDPKYQIPWENGEITRSKIGFRLYAKKYFPKIPIFVSTSYGGCFGVSRDLILKYDIKFYKSLLNTVSQSSNPIESHYLERLWCYMFTKNRFLSQSIFDVIKTKIERFIKN